MKCFSSAVILLAVTPLALGSIASVNKAASTVFQSQRHDGAHDVQQPLHLSSVQEDYVPLHHPSFPRHSVRIRKTNFCDPTVKQVVASTCTKWE
jgi:hypothetical protein